MTTVYNAEEKIWCGKKIKPKYDGKQSIGSLILEALKNKPEHITQISYATGKEYTNEEILLLSIRIAQYLEKLDLNQKDVVGLCAANSDLVAPLFFAFLYRGLIVSTSNPSLDEDGIKNIYSTTKPKLMFCDGSIYHRVRKAFDECGLSATTIYTVHQHIEGVPKLTDLMEEIQREHEFKCVELDMGPNQVVAILSSSGTTGLPKGICLTNVILLNALAALTSVPHRQVSVSALGWVSGVFNLLIPTLNNGTRILSDKPFNPEDFVKIVKRYNITLFTGDPSQLGPLLAYPKLQKNDLVSLKNCFFAGSAAAKTIVDRFRSYVPDVTVFVSYGLTELCGGITIGLAKEDGNCGQIYNNMEVKVIDDCKRNLSPGEIGEICGRNLLYPWAGYYDNPEATAATYDSERWIHTGDLGYIDNKGDLFVIGRKTDILKYNNSYLYPIEIENVILELSDVIHVSVCGIPDEIYTNLLAAAIVKAPGSTLTEKMVCEYIADRMEPHKHLRGGVYFVDELPKTASLKIVRRKVAELCQQNYNNVMNNK